MTDKVIGFMPPLIEGHHVGRLLLTVTLAALACLSLHSLVLLEGMLGDRLRSVHVAKVCGKDLGVYDRIVSTLRLVQDVDARVMLIGCGEPAVTLITPFRLRCDGVTQLVLEVEDDFVVDVNHP